MIDEGKTVPKTGTAWIVWGALLIAWGLIVALNSAITMAGAYIAVALLPIGFGVWLFVIGMNKRRAWQTKA